MADEARARVEPATGRQCDAQALQLGYRVLAVRAAIHEPAAPGAMAAILELGTDSRYYVMVRGWLSMQLQADQSLLEVGGVAARPEIAARVEFLDSAIRALDLE
jgi:hypothetical protein